MPDVLSNWAANAALKYLLKNAFLAAHLSDPTPVGTAGSEVAGGGYERQPINFNDPSNRTSVCNNAQIFAGMPACIVVYLAVWTAIAGGQLIFTKQLVPAITVLASGQLLSAAGDIAISL